MNPLVAAGIISGIGSLASGILGKTSQSSANRTNLQIARETNASNLAIAQDTNAQQKAMFEQQLKYNSPLEQRRMLEEAGYNPYSLYANGGGSVASAPSVPALHAASQYAPTMIPEDAMSRSMGNLVGDISSLIAARASATRDLAEAKSLDTDNALKRVDLMFAVQKRATELRQLGLNVNLTEVMRNIQLGTMDAQIKSAQLNNDYLDTLIGANKEEIISKQMDNFVKRYFAVPEKIAEIKKVLAEAYAAKERGDTEASQRILNDRLGESAIRNAFVNEFLAPSQSAANYGAANQYNQSAALTKAEIKLLPRKFASQYVKDINAIATGTMTQRELASRAAYWSQQAENMYKSGRFIYPKEVLGLVERIGNLFKQLGGMSGQSASPSPISFGPTNGTMGVVPY